MASGFAPIKKGLGTVEGVYIRWTVENWITVVLMAALGYLVFAIAAQLFLGAKKGAAPNLKLVA